MQPNWRALATIHLPLKRFVRAGQDKYYQLANTLLDPSSQTQINGIDGEDAKNFYERLTKGPSKLNTRRSSDNSEKKTRCKSKSTSKPFDKISFFRCASENDAEGLMHFIYKSDDVNIRDEYGWTALMMASCAGAVKAVKALIQLGARKDIADKSGRDALKLAQIKTHTEIVNILSNECNDLDHEVSQTTETNSVILPYFCEICQCSFKETNYRQHLTSTVHQFNSRSSTIRLPAFNVTKSNRGFRIMLKQGWDKESGLGPTKNGRLYPLKTVIRKQRSGLGVKQSAARVTHSGACEPTKWCETLRSRHRNRNDIRQEKQRDRKIERRLRRELC